MIVFCQDKRRRELVLQTTGLNGIDYVEILGDPGCGRTIGITLLKDARQLGLTAANIQLTGETALAVTSLNAPTDEDPYTVTVQLENPGDFSLYTLTLIASGSSASQPGVLVDPPTGVDRQLSSVSLSFKAGCPTPADCAPDSCRPVTAIAPPDIHYLARDYDGFRQTMLDRLAVLVPEWKETHVADPMITFVEALAYAGDRISYMQDAVNTEAYIGTARSRISLRRHARLVDYWLNEGSNARAWVVLTASLNDVVVPAGTRIFPLMTGLKASVLPTSDAAAQIEAGPGPVFETLEEVVLYTEQNSINFYTWGDGQCCLTAGATEAWLVGTLETLTAGQVLLFEEILGPNTGDPADADPIHRWVVRLTVVETRAANGDFLIDPVNGTALTHIVWAEEDALPSPVCLSSLTDAEHGSIALPAVSVARGNVVATDQGVWIRQEDLGLVPDHSQSPVSGQGCDCSDGQGTATPGPRYNPTLAQQPLTYAIPYSAGKPATTFLKQDSFDAEPQIWLVDEDAHRWSPVLDLLDREDNFKGFLPENEADLTTRLRFGDGVYGEDVEPGQRFFANYRIGNGRSGNVGREALAHVIFSGPGIGGVRNPIAAAGGTDPENMEHIRQNAPFQFQSQLRCVTADDYGVMAAKLPGIREAKGTMRWTGSWYTVFVSLAPVAKWTPQLASSVTSSLVMLRMMGTDVVAEQARFVGIRIRLHVCISSRYFRGDVYDDLTKVLIAGDTCTGASALLSVTNSHFGANIYASPILAAAQGVAGVVSVSLLTFERMDSPLPAGAVPPPFLTMGRLEIARCDNDPNHADYGSLTFALDGGK